MAASVKAVTFRSPSDSFSGGTQLNHIPFTGRNIYSEHAAAKGAGSVEECWSPQCLRGSYTTGQTSDPRIWILGTNKILKANVYLPTLYLSWLAN